MRWLFPFLGLNITTVVIPLVLLALLIAGVGTFAILRKYVTSHLNFFFSNYINNYKTKSLIFRCSYVEKQHYFFQDKMLTYIFKTSWIEVECIKYYFMNRTYFYLFFSF